MKFIICLLLIWSSNTYACQTCNDSAENGTEAVLEAVKLPVHIKVFTDFTCKFCKQGSLTMDSLSMLYGKLIDVEPAAYPLSAKGPALEAAQFFEAFKLISPEKALDYARALHRLENKNTHHFIKAAKYLGVSVKKLKHLAQSDQVSHILEKTRQDAKLENIKGVPAYLINGRQTVTGARPLTYFENIFGRPDKNDGC